MDVCNAALGHRREDEIRQVTVESIVDTGAWTIDINEDIREKLGLLDKGYGEATLADGKKDVYKMAGPLEIKWKNRRFVGEALVLPDAPDILLGGLLLFAMDLMINPNRELVVVHGDILMRRV